MKQIDDLMDGTGDNGKDDNRTEEEADLWAYVARSVEPLPGREPGGEKLKPPSRKKVQKKDTPPEIPILLPRAEAKSREVDRRTGERLRRGRMKIEARLDLHGLNRVDAHAALHGFLARCYEQDMRHVLVITGKGSRGGSVGEPGILRQSVPQWLDDAPLRDIVLQFYNARRHHGGEGALYVLLRRKRDRG